MLYTERVGFILRQLQPGMVIALNSGTTNTVPAQEIIRVFPT